jgi:hypothetical protein
MPTARRRPRFGGTLRRTTGEEEQEQSGAQRQQAAKQGAFDLLGGAVARFVIGDIVDQDLKLLRDIVYYGFGGGDHAIPLCGFQNVLVLDSITGNRRSFTPWHVGNAAATMRIEVRNR